MLKAAFFGENPHSIGNVYSAETIARIRTMAELPDRVICKNDLGKEDFSDIEFLFGTWGIGALTEEEWAKYFPNLKVLFYGAGATDRFARPLFARGVHVVSAWQANAVPVAEYTVSAILLGLKNFYQLIRTGRSPEHWRERSTGTGAFGATVTLLGSTGAVATRVAEMLKSYRLKVIGIPSPVAERTISFAEAFPVSNVVSNHLPDRDDNAGCIDGALLDSMPKGGFFLNTGRGRQVNEPEMIEVLKRRPDLTVLLDVQYPEPPEAGSELYTLPNVFLTPHIAGSLGDEVHRMGEFMADEFERFTRGEPLLYEVCESMLLTSQTKK